MKILILFIAFFIFFTNTFANSQKLEDVFLDISKDYEYYDLLQTLYDKGMIKPDEESKLNPNKPLTRDEFVGIVMEVSCVKCIKPDTALDFILKYKTPPYYDVLNENKYFYCISEAKEIETVKGYDISHKCEDGTFKSGESPFCVNNTITLEEALAFLLRNSSVFSVSDNEKIKALISAGYITEKLANDLSPKNSDGSVYTFYGYFKKRLELNYLEYDIYGNEKKISLLEKDSYGNLNPKKIIKKNDFIRMSYVISKMNSCKIDNLDFTNTQENKNSLQIEIYDKECKIGEKNCKKSDLKDEEGIYDFGEEYKTTCEKGVKGYNWYFYNNDTKETYTINKEYIDNYKLKNYGKRTIKLEVSDNCGNKNISTSTIDYKKENKGISVSIEGKPIQGIGPLNVDLNSIIGGCEKGDCKYNWNFGDGETSQLEDEKHIFKYPGNYTVELEVTRDDGTKSKANIVVSVIEGKIKDLLDNYDRNKDGKVDYKDSEIREIIEIIEKNDKNKDGKVDNNDDNIGDIKKIIEQYDKNKDGKIDDKDFKNDIDLSTIDTDKDGVFDDKDKCILVSGDKNNYGCPVLDNRESCSKKSEINTCAKGYICSNEGFCEYVGVNNDLVGTCLYPKSGSSIFGNAICNTCPCNYNLDFLRTIRKCDALVPAITSINGQKIFSFGNTYIVGQNK